MIRILMIFAGILLIGSGALTRFLDSAVTPTRTKAAVVRADAPRDQAASGRTMKLDSGRDAQVHVSLRAGESQAAGNRARMRSVQPRFIQLAAAAVSGDGGGWPSAQACARGSDLKGCAWPQ